MIRPTIASWVIATALLGAAVAQPPVVPAPVVPPDETQQEPVPPAPVDVAALRQQAARAELAGDHAAAGELYLQLAAAEPTNTEWVVRGAESLGKAGNYNDALDALDAAHQRFPDVVSITAMLARTFHLKADAGRASGVFDSNVMFLYHDAIRTSEQVLEIDPRHLDAHLLIASSRFHLGELDAAKVVAETAIGLQPDGYGPNAMLGRVVYQQYLDLQQVKQTEQPKGNEATAMQARIDALGAAAIASFTKAAAAEPTRSLPHIRLGDLAAWTGDLEGALGHYQRAMVVEPRAALNHEWLRTALPADRREAFYSATLAAYRATPTADAAGAGVIEWYIGQSCFDARDWAGAAKHFEVAQQTVPAHLDTYWWLFQSQYWAGEAGPAAQTAAKFAAVDPIKFAEMIFGDEQTLAVLIGMAAEAFRANRTAACRDLNQVIAYTKRTADAWNNYAFLCRETGRFEDSLRGYREALDLEPDSPQLLNDAAVILHYHLKSPDNLELARDYYRRAIALAEQQLASGELRGEPLDRTRTALRDARNNLRDLDGGR